MNLTDKEHKVLKMGIGQLDNEGLKRLIVWNGKILLDGNIRDSEGLY